MKEITDGNGMPDQKGIEALPILAQAQVVDYRKSDWTRGIGMIVSNEMAASLPGACEQCTGGGTVTHYEALIPVLVKAIQELSEKVEGFSEKVDFLTKMPVVVSAKKTKAKEK